MVINYNWVLTYVRSRGNNNHNVVPVVVIEGINLLNGGTIFFFFNVPSISGTTPSLGISSGPGNWFGSVRINVFYNVIQVFIKGRIGRKKFLRREHSFNCKCRAKSRYSPSISRE